MKDTVKRVDRIVCCERNKVYSKTIVLLSNGLRAEFVDSEHPDWVNLRAGDTVEYRYSMFNDSSQYITGVEYALDA